MAQNGQPLEPWSMLTVSNSPCKHRFRTLDFASRRSGISLINVESRGYAYVEKLTKLFQLAADRRECSDIERCESIFRGLQADMAKI